MLAGTEDVCEISKLVQPKFQLVAFLSINKKCSYATAIGNMLTVSKFKCLQIQIPANEKCNSVVQLIVTTQSVPEKPSVLRMRGNANSSCLKYDKAMYSIFEYL